MGMFSFLGGGGGSAKRAAGVQAGGQREAADIIKKQYEETATQYKPYQEAGTSALGQYQNFLPGLEAPTEEMYGLSQQMDPILAKIQAGNYQESPGYEFRMEQGRKALEASAAAKGGLFSGGFGKALTQYGQNFGTNEYDNYINRLRAQLGDVGTQMGGRQNALNAQYGQLSAYAPLIQQGYGATNSLAGLGANAASQRAGYTSGAANAMASGMLQKDAQMTNAGNLWAGTWVNSMLGGKLQQASQSGQQQQQTGEQGGGATGEAQGQEGGGWGKTIGSAALAYFSDKRIKENIKLVDKKNGFNIYEFKYKGQDGRYKGVMAQEVEKTRPDAVIEINGIKAVNYDKLGLKMEAI